MRNLVGIAVMCAALGLAGGQAGAQPAKEAFPLAAPAGKDSNARQVAPPGAMNQGPFDNKTWKYGNAFPVPAGAKIWNPAKLKLMQGGKLVGGTVRGAVAPNVYCAMANAGYDFIWTEMQHEGSSWAEVWRAWNTCRPGRAWSTCAPRRAGSRRGTTAVHHRDLWAPG